MKLYLIIIYGFLELLDFPIRVLNPYYLPIVKINHQFKLVGIPIKILHQFSIRYFVRYPGKNVRVQVIAQQS